MSTPAGWSQGRTSADLDDGIDGKLPTSSSSAKPTLSATDRAGFEPMSLEYIL